MGEEGIDNVEVVFGEFKLFFDKLRLRLGGGERSTRERLGWLVRKRVGGARERGEEVDW